LKRKDNKDRIKKGSAVQHSTRTLWMEVLRLRASAFPRGGPTRGRARGKYLASDICLAGLSCRRKRVKGGEKRSAPGTLRGTRRRWSTRLEEAMGGSGMEGSDHHNLE